MTVIGETSLTACQLESASANKLGIIAVFDIVNVVGAHLAHLDAVGVTGPSAPQDVGQP